MSLAEHTPTFAEKRLARVTANDKDTLLEQVLIKGDLANLSTDERNTYYMRVCESAGLNPLTKPFEYIKLNGKLVLYALRSCTDQLRAIHGVSVIDMDEDMRGDVLVIKVKVQDKHGRTDMATGAVSLGKLSGEALANAIMKAETKAKRRATLSITGLGLLDETEVETIPNARVISSTADAAAGENPPSSPEARQPRRSNVVINPATGKEIDTENARNQRPEWAKFVDRVQGYIDARDAEGLRQWFTGDDVAAYVAGWVFRDQAEEHFEAAIDRIEQLERQ